MTTKHLGEGSVPNVPRKGSEGKKGYFDKVVSAQKSGDELAMRDAHVNQTKAITGSSNASDVLKLMLKRRQNRMKAQNMSGAESPMSESRGHNIIAAKLKSIAARSTPSNEDDENEAKLRKQAAEVIKNMGKKAGLGKKTTVGDEKHYPWKREARDTDPLQPTGHTKGEVRPKEIDNKNPRW